MGSLASKVNLLQSWECDGTYIVWQIKYLWDLAGPCPGGSRAPALARHGGLKTAEMGKKSWQSPQVWEGLDGRAWSCPSTQDYSKQDI